jgi:hypothetical protein
MRKLIYKIIFVLLLSIVPLRLIGIFDNTVYDNRDVTRIKVSEQFKNLDYLILGNSHSYAGVDISLFDSVGLKAYNLACPAAGQYTIKLVLENYLKATGTPPKNIIINLGPEMFSPSSDVFEKYPIHRYLHPAVTNERLLLNEMIGVGEYGKLFVKSAKKGFQKIVSQNNKLEELLIKQTTNSKGFALRPGVYSEALFKSDYNKYKVFSTYDYDTKKEKAFFALLDYCHSLNIKVYLHPIPNNKLATFLSPQLAAGYADLLNNLMLKKNVAVLIYPDYFPEYWFADIDHMNNSGATIYTRFLLQKIIH